MKDILSLEKKIIPEMTEILEKRYNILRNVFYYEPIGRRTLANNLGIGERIIRSEVNILREQGLLEIKSMGMNVTEEGKLIIEELKDFIHSLKGLTSLESALEEKLKIKKVFIVPGNYDEDPTVLKDLGRKASLHIKNIVEDNNIIGITGGNTMAQVAEGMPFSKVERDLLVLPARGGIGRSVETQSNNIAAKLAQRLRGHYKLLHVPDTIGKEAFKTLLQVEEIKELIDMIKQIDILVFGIGRADNMARRRKLPDELIRNIIERGGVAEAFGYYFNLEGKIVEESSTVGLSLVDFKETKHVIGVASGANKADAIMAISALKRDITLVTDEGAARAIINKVR